MNLESSSLSTGVGLSIISSTEPRDASDADRYRAAEVERRAQIASSAVIQNELARALTVAADQFVVTRGERKTIVAGYHCFADWGRDTMIALPGLALATGRYEIAQRKARASMAATAS